MTSPKILAKAHDYLIQGKVLVLKADLESASFAVQGSGPRPYAVSASQGHWHCECPATVDVCAHIQAGKLIYKSEYNKPKLPGKSVEDIFNMINPVDTKDDNPFL